MKNQFVQIEPLIKEYQDEIPSRNKFFSNWGNANEVILEKILPNLGLYAQSEGANLSVSIFPYTMPTYIPGFVKSLFDARVALYFNWYRMTTEIDEILEQHKNEFMSATLLSYVQMQLMDRERVYRDRIDPYYFEKKFLVTMGVIPSSYLHIDIKMYLKGGETECSAQSQP